MARLATPYCPPALPCSTGFGQRRLQDECRNRPTLSSAQCPFLGAQSKFVKPGLGASPSRRPLPLRRIGFKALANPGTVKGLNSDFKSRCRLRWQDLTFQRPGKPKTISPRATSVATAQVLERENCPDGLFLVDLFAEEGTGTEAMQEKENAAATAQNSDSDSSGANWKSLVGLLFMLCFLTAADKGVMSLAPMTMAQEFGWAEAEKGLVGSAFFIGFMLSQVSGGLVQHKVGRKKLMLGGLAWFSLCSLLSPLAARHSLHGLLAMRALLGIGEGVTVPILTSMLADSIPAEARSKSLALVFSGGTLGTVAALLACPALMSSLGWQSLYLIIGGASAAWCAAWSAFAPQDIQKAPKPLASVKTTPPPAKITPPSSPRSPLASPPISVAIRTRRWRLAAQPDTLQWSINVLRRRIRGLSAKTALVAGSLALDSPRSSKGTLMPEAAGIVPGGGAKRRTGGPVGVAVVGLKKWVLVRTGREVEENEEEQIPWGDFVKCRALWGVAGAHFCSSWSWSVMMTWIPAYFTSHLGANLASSSLLSLGPWCACFMAGNLSGWLADWLSGTGMNKTQVRKLMQGIAFLGPAVCLSFLSRVNNIPEAVLLLSATLALGSFSSGGFLSNHADISPRHAGLLFAFTNTVGCLAGVTSVALTGLILDQFHDWTLVWLGTALMYIIGTAWYTWLADTEKLFD